VVDGEAPPDRACRDGVPIGLGFGYQAQTLGNPTLYGFQNLAFFNHLGATFVNEWGCRQWLIRKMIERAF
jgi:hypothetical protein